MPAAFLRLGVAAYFDDLTVVASNHVSDTIVSPKIGWTVL